MYLWNWHLKKEMNISDSVGFCSPHTEKLSFSETLDYGNYHMATVSIIFHYVV